MRAKKDLKKHLYTYTDHDIIYAFKMMGSQNRMKILHAIGSNPGVNLDQLTNLVGGEFKNISFHSRKLYQSKLIVKKTVNLHSKHYLTEYGKKAIQVFSIFEKVPHI